MIAYNKTWLENLRLQQQLKSDLSKGRITVAEFKSIAEKYPVGFYTPGVFARVGLAILTFIIVLFADGLLSLMASSSNVVENGGWFFFLAGMTYLALELIVYAKNHYQSGVDDALTFIAGVQFVIGFYILISNNGSHNLILSEIVFAISFYLSLRFTDLLAATICCLSFFAFIFFGWTQVIHSGLTTAPFIIMLFAAYLYWRACAYANRISLVNYHNCLVVAQLISLLALYAAGNYYVIQSLSSEMTGNTAPVPFGMFFWAWTILLPFVYIGFGVKRKNPVLLRTGLLLIAAAAVTFRNYHHVLPVDAALTLAGAIMLGVVYAIMQYLKTPKYGFTYAEPDEEHLMDNLKIESLIIAETFAHTPQAPTDTGTKFGGGDFGGGGSSGSF